MSEKILILEDDDFLRGSLVREFSDLGYEVASFASSQAFLDSDLRSFDYAILDLRLGFESGLDHIAKLKGANSSIRILILTGYGSIANATKAIKLGASHYLIKPASLSEILAALKDESLAYSPKPRDSMPSLAEHERDYIEYVLEQCRGNKTTAANLLKIPRQSLQRKLRKFSPWRKAQP